MIILLLLMRQIQQFSILFLYYLILCSVLMQSVYILSNFYLVYDYSLILILINGLLYLINDLDNLNRQIDNYVNCLIGSYDNIFYVSI